MTLDFSTGLAAWSINSSEITAATRWRLLATAPVYNPGGYVEIFRLSFYTTLNATGTDVALSGSAFSSSAYPGNPASYAFDGNDATRWACAAPPATGQWIGVQLASPAIVRSLSLIAYNPSDACIPTFAKLQCSDDGAVWRDISTISPLNIGAPFNTEALQTFSNLQ